MPKLVNAVPKYRKHRGSGQAVVCIDGREIYLGPHGTAVSKREYDRLVSEWLLNGRRSPPKPEVMVGLTITELIARYWQFAKGYYRKGGKPSGTLDHIKVVLRVLKQCYGHTVAADFGPLAYKTVRQKMVQAGQSRMYVNRQCGHLARVFKWGVGEELIPPSVHQALQTVPGLKRGRTEAPDHSPVAPLPEAVFQATLPYMPPVVADMARLQRLTGSRPGEVCILRPCDVDHSGGVWEYRPESHKTEHQGRERIIFIGPKGQNILRPYLLREEESYCFAPVESERDRHADMRARRKSKVQPSQEDRRKLKPKRTAGACYTRDSYRRAIQRAVELANRDRKKQKQEPLPLWGPHRLRHSAATEIRKRFGLEAAQVMLGHAAADVTQLYAERDAEKGREVARRIG